MKKLEAANPSSLKTEERVWVPDAVEGFVMGIVIRNVADDRVLLRIDGSNRQMTTYSGLFCVVINPYKWMPHIYSNTVMSSYRGRKRHEVPPHVFAVTDCAYRDMLHRLLDKIRGYFQNVADDRVLLRIDGSNRQMTTYSGLFCVVINPYKWMPHIYSNTVMSSYRGRKRHEVPPHVFAVTDCAYRDMLHRAGKTENTKKIIQYLADVAGAGRHIRPGGSRSPGRPSTNLLQPSVTHGALSESMSSVGHLEDQLLLANPILEAFGNSKTVKNDNSSRFGKFIRISFDQNGSLLLDDIDNYRFLTNGNLPIPDVDDATELSNTVDAMKGMDFAESDIDAIMRITSAVLLLGNMSFTEDRTSEQAVLVDDRVAQKICCLLGLPVSDLTRAFLKPRVKVGRDYVHKAQTREQVQYAVEAIAKACYERMFRLLVIRINRSLGRTTNSATTFIGILDIAGFEIFELNSFEQLCINYTNEKLQQLFNNTMHAKFIVPEFRTKSDFAIIHYAGRVDYSAGQWLMKNMDPLNDSVVYLLQNSSDQFVSEMWKNAEFASLGMTVQSDDMFGARTKKGMFRTVGQTYKEQLARLMKTLQNTTPHFVRCIIPNHEKKAGVINGPLVLDQLRCNGVLEGIRICRQGYPNRMPFHDLRRRYELLVEPGTIPPGFLDGKEAVRRMLSALEVDPSLFSIGQSKVFFRSGVIAALEELRDKELERFAIRFQAHCRGYLARRTFKKLMQQVSAIRIIQRNGVAWKRLKDWQWWRLFAKVKPLLEVTASENAIAAKETELKCLRETLQQKESDLLGYTSRIEQLTSDRADLQKLLEAESAEKTDLEDMKDQLASTKMQLETQLVNLRRHYEEKEAEVSSACAARKKLEDDLVVLKKQLREQTETCEKVQAVNVTVEQKLKNLTAEKDQLAEANEKIAKEKMLLEERFSAATQKVVTEEEQNRQNVKLKAKLEAQLADLEHENKMQKKAFETAEAANRKLTAETRSLRESNEDLLKKLNQLSTQLKKKEEELITTLTRCDEEQSQKQTLSKQNKELMFELQELKEDLESEKALRAKSERGKRDYMEELEALKQELLESQDKTQANVQLRAEREKQYLSVKKELEESTNQYEQIIADLKEKHSKQLDEIRMEMDQLKKQMQQAAKTKSRVENELQEKVLLIEQNQSARMEAERKKKSIESQLNEWQTKAQEAEANNAELESTLTKTQSEIARLTQELEKSESSCLALRKKVADFEAQNAELHDTINLEKSQNDTLQKRLQAREDEMEVMRENKERDESAIQKYEKEISSLKQQLIIVNKKNEEKLLEQSEELHKKLSKELEDCRKELEQSEYVRSRAEKAKEKLMHEVRSNDLLDAFEMDIENLTNRVAELENIRNTLQLELDNAVTMKDDSGRNALELDRSKRQLEAELAQAKEVIIELEDSLQLAEDARLRLDVTLQTTNAELEKVRSEREREEDERRKAAQRK
ncbi:unnamed protein product, partial [Gongylonema pulchrum]|uniref:Myosin motor domain-containing protein n=1 Tax=Gongylonema pulchrum TaxID=637853 RepID=A0A183DPU8_9BILA